jgi:uncharacterized protein YciI
VASIDTSRLLKRTYWLARSSPRDGTSAGDFDALLHEHLAWLLDLERRGRVFLSGPLQSGPGVSPGAGVTVFRAESEEDARRLASGDPFVLAGLRDVDVFCWVVNEGHIRVELSLGAGSFHWE